MENVFSRPFKPTAGALGTSQINRLESSVKYDTFIY